MKPRQTLEALLLGLQGGMTTEQAMPFFSNVVDTRQANQEAKQQAMLDQQQALEDARSESVQGLESLIADQAIGGVGLPDLKREIAIRYGSEMQQMPELGGYLDQLLDTAYPRGPSYTNKGLPPSVAVKGGLDELATANAGRGRLGARSHTSPLVPPPEPEDPISWDILDDDTRAEVAGAVTSAKAKGIPPERVLQDALKSAKSLGATPDELEAIRNEIAFLWEKG
jgi:hypothetical protein